MKTKFYTQYSRPSKDDFLERPCHEDLVEKAGYVPPHVLIESFMIAGRRLQAHRQQFDFSSDEDLDLYYSDPTRRLDYDLADATQEELRLTQMFKDAKKVNKGDKGGKNSRDSKSDSDSVNNSDHGTGPRLSESDAETLEE